MELAFQSTRESYFYIRTFIEQTFQCALSIIILGEPWPYQIPPSRLCYRHCQWISTTLTWSKKPMLLIWQRVRYCNILKEGIHSFDMITGPVIMTGAAQPWARLYFTVNATPKETRSKTTETKHSMRSEVSYTQGENSFLTRLDPS